MTEHRCQLVGQPHTRRTVDAAAPALAAELYVEDYFACSEGDELRVSVTPCWSDERETFRVVIIEGLAAAQCIGVKIGGAR